MMVPHTLFLCSLESLARWDSTGHTLMALLLALVPLSSKLALTPRQGTGSGPCDDDSAHSGGADAKYVCYALLFHPNSNATTVKKEFINKLQSPVRAAFLQCNDISCPLGSTPVD